MEHASHKVVEELVGEEPTKLDNWLRCSCWLHSFEHLRGNVYNHPNFSDGEDIHTSQLIQISGNIGVCTRRTYHLLRPAKEANT